MSKNKIFEVTLQKEKKKTKINQKKIALIKEKVEMLEKERTRVSK